MSSSIDVQEAIVNVHENPIPEEGSSSETPLEIDVRPVRCVGLVISSSNKCAWQSEQSDERDSAFGDNQSSYTMSATSSVFNFRYENGRRYHGYAEGKYPVPNDEVSPTPQSPLWRSC